MNINIGKRDYLIKLNRKNEIEFDCSDGSRGVMDEKSGFLIVEGGKRTPLKKETISEVAAYRSSIRKELVEYYNQLLKGEEKLELLLTEDAQDYPYIITSEKLLDRGYESEKYAEVLESIFYPSTLKKIGVKMDKPFQGMHDVHQRLSQVKDIPVSNKVVSITLLDLMKVVNG